MAWITDGLSSAFALASRLNPFAERQTPMAGMFSHQFALAAYMQSGLARKAITIPAADRTQKWRDWQADKPTIALIEEEEKRLGLRAKVKHAEILRGVGGGALVLITAGDHATPLDVNAIRKGGLVAINVATRWEIRPIDFDRDLASPTYRQPRMFEVSGEGTKQRIHPSRIICFRGDALPAGGAIADEEAFWGDCRLLRIFKEVQNSDHAQEWFVELVKKAKLLRIGIPDLLDMVATADGHRRLNERIALIATGESSLNATVYRSGTGADDPGEKIEDYQINWSGIPAFMDALDKRVAAVADIPVTRLFGTSPGGMNATGEHDLANWWDAVGDGQENETRPCLEALDPILLRSAGVTKTDAWWVWAPLRKPTEAEEAKTFDLLMDAVGKLIDSGTVPERSLAEAVQNVIEERGYLPGLAAALAKLPPEIRFGISPEDGGEDDDPSALTQQQEGGDQLSADPSGEDGSRTARRRAANDKVPDEGEE
jgi:phage-related protein (TIGR01555 family)